MLHPILVLSLIAGCPGNTSANNDPDGRPKISVGDFHSVGNPDKYCGDNDLGTALGWQTLNPWTDRLLCAGVKGIYEVDATKNGADVGVHLRNWRPLSDPDFPAVWIASPYGGNSHISVTKELMESCPNKGRLIAIFPNNGTDDMFQGGMLMDTGMIACVEDTALVLYLVTDPGRTAPVLFASYPNFTPAH